MFSGTEHVVITKEKRPGLLDSRRGHTTEVYFWLSYTLRSSTASFPLSEVTMAIPMASTTPDDFTFSLAEIPQDPFLPQGLLKGPAFLDTQACLCAYRQTPISDSNAAAWECIGNQTNGIDVYTGGKWFRPTRSAIVSDEDDENLGPIWDASNGPDVSAPLIFDAEQDDLVTIDESRLSPYDAACTGLNHTRFSGTFYRAVEQRNNNETMVDAAPCYRGPYAVPMQIMGLEQWQQEGCMEGFLCE